MALQSFNNPNSDVARQHLLDRRCERKHPKRHRTKKRSVKQRAARKQRVLVRAATGVRADGLRTSLRRGSLMQFSHCGFDGAHARGTSEL